MKKHLRSGFALIYFAMPGLALAIGFGTPSVDSYLGEPLRIKVPLISVTNSDLDELRVSLADRSWYQAAGLEYPEIAEQLLIGLDLEIMDEPAVTVTTANPVNQIMVPLVLELNWPTRVMRNQLTVLLNPVEYQAARRIDNPLAAEGLVEAAGTVGVASPGVSSPGLSREEESIIAETEEIVDESAGGVSSSQTGGGATFTDSDNSSTTEDITAAASIPDTVVVNAGDSLSTIVDRFLPAGADRYQGRMAFYDANPEAFYDGDIHHLIKGVELNVPKADVILNISSQDARSRYLSLAEVVPSWTDSMPVESDSLDELVNDGFRLSLIELPEQEGGDASGEFDSRVLQSGALNSDPQFKSVSSNEAVAGDNPLIADAGAESVRPGPAGSGLAGSGPAGSGPVGQGVEQSEFEMQGFSMKLTVMNAYIVELQDENRQLKERVATLEQQVEQLVAQVGRDVGVAPRDQSIAGVTEPLETDAVFVDRSDTPVNQPTIDLEEPAEMDVLSPDENEAMMAEAAEQTDEVKESGEAIEDTVADLIVSQLETEQAKPLVDVPVEQAELGDDAVTSPRVIFRNELLAQAKSILGPVNTPIVQLILAILVMGFLLLAWMLRREKKQKRREVAVVEKEFNLEDVPYTEGEGVSYEAGNTVATLDLSDTEEPWTVNKEMTEADLDNLQESAVDPITQSEVYLTYNRPQQAIEVLWEEYAKPDSDKFVVAKRILKVYQSMGDNEHRNASMRNFIVSLNDDIEVFTRPQWDELRDELDALRKTEQTEAIEGVTELDQAYQLESKDSLAPEQRKSPELPVDSDVVEALDDGLIDLEYDVPDEAQAR